MTIRKGNKDVKDAILQAKSTYGPSSRKMVEHQEKLERYRNLMHTGTSSVTNKRLDPILERIYEKEVRRAGEPAS